MESHPDQVSKSTPEEKAVNDALVQSQQHIVAQKRIEAASTQCYVIGATSIGIGGLIGLTSPYFLWTIILSVFGLIMTLVGIVLHRRSTHGYETLELLDLDDSKPERPDLSPNKRPELSINKTILRMATGGVVNVVLEITNRGELTAYNFRLEGFVIGMPGDFVGPLENYSKEVSEEYPEVAPNATFCTHIKFELIVTDVILRSIKERQVLFFGYFRGEYTDESGKTYSLERCLLYRPELDTFALAPRGYWPKGKPKERPEVSINLIDVRIPPIFAETTIAIEIANKGQITAYGFQCYYWTYFRSPEDAELQIPTLPPIAEPITCPPIARDQTYTIYLGFPTVKPVTWEMIYARTWEMYILLKAQYTNEEKWPSYEFERCYMYNPTSNRLMIARKECWPEGFKNPN